MDKPFGKETILPATMTGWEYFHQIFRRILRNSHGQEDKIPGNPNVTKEDNSIS